MTSLSIQSYKFIEGKEGDTGTMRFVVLLSEAAAQDVTMNYATADSTAKNAATAGTDYTAASGSLTIKAGDLSGVVTVNVLGDGIKESDEVFNLTLSAPTGAGFANGDALTVIGTILDDEKTLSVAAAKLIEGKQGDTGTMQFVVSLSEAAKQDVTVTYATADSTAKNAATAGTDYTATTGSLTILAGFLSGIVKVNVLGDGIKESNEVFDLILSAPTGAGFAKGDTITVVGTIIDDEPIIYFA